MQAELLGTEISSCWASKLKRIEDSWYVRNEYVQNFELWNNYEIMGQFLLTFFVATFWTIFWSLNPLFGLDCNKTFSSFGHMKATLDSWINIGLCLLIFGLFSRGYVPYYRGWCIFVFKNIRYLMLWRMPILRAMLNVFAKCSRDYVYSRGYVYSRV